MSNIKFTSNNDDGCYSLTFTLSLNKNTSLLNKNTSSLLIKNNKLHPIQCNNDDNINDINWRKYYYRCKLHFNNGKFNSIKNNIIISNESRPFYIHIWKAGGTTIKRGIKRLLNNKKLINLNDSSIPYRFTFVRDPIKKLISGFSEVNMRIINNNKETSHLNNTKIANISKSLFYNNNTNKNDIINLFRLWLLNMSTNGDFYFIDNHILPNLLYLHQKPNISFIGNLENISYILPNILSKYINDKSLLQEDNKLMNIYFNINNKLNDRHKRDIKYNKFNLEYNDLNDNDIKMICNIYWLDYLCLPFEFPKQCNMSYLLQNHYYKHITYNKQC